MCRRYDYDGDIERKPNMRALLTALLLLAGPSSALAQSGATTEFDTVGEKAIDRTTQMQDIKFRDDGYDRMTVPVRLLDTGPYRFLVDTGADRSAISSDLARRLKLQAGYRTSLHNVGKTETVSTAIIPRLRLTRKDMNVYDAAVLEKSHMGADGILGVDTLKSDKVIFDFEGQTMSIVPSSAREAQSDGQAIVITANRRNGRLVVTSARANDRRVAVVLDTGAQISIGNPAMRAQLLGNRPVNPAGMVSLTTVTGEVVSGECVFIDSLRLGDVNMKDVGIVFADSPAFRKLELADKPAMLLGMNAMRAFKRVSIDFGRRKFRVVVPEHSALDTELASPAGFSPSRRQGGR
jgi:predicted aspartyl protease